MSYTKLLHTVTSSLLVQIFDERLAKQYQRQTQVLKAVKKC